MSEEGRSGGEEGRSGGEEGRSGGEEGRSGGENEAPSDASEAPPPVRRPSAGERMAEAEPRMTEEQRAAGRTGAPVPPPVIESARYGRYVGLLGIVILIAITLNTFLTKPNGDAGVNPGRTVPPFAVPLAQSTLEGDADVATSAGEGAAGKVPACKERGPRILNVCELYEQGPVVLALFVDKGSCPGVLDDLQALAPDFPRVRFAAVAIHGNRGHVRDLIRSHGWTFPVGLDEEGTLAALYSLASCPQVSFIDRGGVVQSKALLGRPARSELRTRIQQLLAASQAAR
ncbi:MAG TPA: hypothetical protein VH025_01385 [Solirubrobacteraceae bacterium]|nr:hypothetical protein [Solirubrobacteraceae bacterium]